jgi:phospholipase C
VAAQKLEPILYGSFVNDYALAYPRSSTRQRQEVMDYYPPGFLPATHARAREFTICDRWHSSLPGPTWANRFFVHSGTALGRVWMPEKKEDLPNLRPYDQTTLYDRLNDRKVTWRVYFGDIPQSLVLTRQLRRENIVHYRPMDCFYEDTAKPANEFPEYCFIEPRYFFSDANDDHPPHNTMHAQCLIADVYNALRQNEELWNESLFVLMYDEHGGFFDHVPPPEAVRPDDFHDEYGFDRLGVRVPVILASPWAKRGVLSKPFDHSSLLKYLTEKWSLGPLGKRVASANGIDAAFDTAARRADTLVRIDDNKAMSDARLESRQPDAEQNGHQRALLAFRDALATCLDAGALPSILQSQAMTASPTSEIDEAKAMVTMLVEQERRKAGLR